MCQGSWYPWGGSPFLKKREGILSRGVKMGLKGEAGLHSGQKVNKQNNGEKKTHWLIEMN